MDVKVLREDDTEVELMENIDYTDTDIHSIIEGDKRFIDNDKESYASMGFMRQEFDDEELVNSDEEYEGEEDDDYLELEDEMDEE